MKRIYLSETTSVLSSELSRLIPLNEMLQVTKPTVEELEGDYNHYNQVKTILKELRPDYVVILPGHTPFEVENHALVSNLIGARVIYVSDAEVFSGDKQNQEILKTLAENGNIQVKVTYIHNDEYDWPSPKTPKGRECLHAEQYIQRYVKRFTIVRPGLIYDPIKMATITNPYAFITGDPLVSPTPVTDLADALMVIINKYLFGIYHFANTGEGCTFSELVRKYQPLLKVKPVEPKPGEPYCHNQLITGHKYEDRSEAKIPPFALINYTPFEPV